MKFSLDIYIICNNPVILDELEGKVHAKTDAKVWGIQYRKYQGTDEDGNKFLSAIVRFHQDVDRAVAWNWFENKVREDEILPQILAGSYLRLHKCYHDEIPIKPCEKTEILKWP